MNSLLNVKAPCFSPTYDFGGTKYVFESLVIFTLLIKSYAYLIFLTIRYLSFWILERATLKIQSSWVMKYGNAISFGLTMSQNLEGFTGSYIGEYLFSGLRISITKTI